MARHPFDRCPRQDSNLRFRLRRAALYPLSYGGPARSSVRPVRLAAGPVKRGMAPSPNRSAGDGRARRARGEPGRASGCGPIRPIGPFGELDGHGADHGNPSRYAAEARCACSTCRPTAEELRQASSTSPPSPVLPVGRTCTSTPSGPRRAHSTGTTRAGRRPSGHELHRDAVAQRRRRVQVGAGAQGPRRLTDDAEQPSRLDVRQPWFSNRSRNCRGRPEDGSGRNTTLRTAEAECSG